MDSVLSPLELVTGAAPEGPVAIARPHRVAAAATWFRSHFPGEVFYAVKANPAPWVLDTLWAAGIKNFDVASEAEAALVAERFQGAQIAFMHPVKSRRAIATGPSGAAPVTSSSGERTESIRQLLKQRTLFRGGAC